MREFNSKRHTDRLSDFCLYSKPQKVAPYINDIQIVPLLFSYSESYVDFETAQVFF